MDKVMEFLDGVGRELSSKQLKVGFLRGATYPDGVSVPMVAAVNEFGNPANNQPPRPFFRSAIAENESKWQESIGKFAEQEMDSNDALSLLGEVIADDIRGSIRQLVTPPLSPVTVAKKGFNKPLIDTSHMLNSVDYEVSEIESSTDSQ